MRSPVRVRRAGGVTAPRRTARNGWRTTSRAAARASTVWWSPRRVTGPPGSASSIGMGPPGARPTAARPWATRPGRARSPSRASGAAPSASRSRMGRARRASAHSRSTWSDGHGDRSWPTGHFSFLRMRTIRTRCTTISTPALPPRPTLCCPSSGSAPFRSTMSIGVPSPRTTLRIDGRRAATTSRETMATIMSGLIPFCWLLLRKPGGAPGSARRYS